MEDLTVRIRADVSGLMNGLRQARTGIAGLDRNTKSSQRSLGGWMRVAAGSTAALGLGKLIKDSVTLEATYSKTMAQIAVATGAPKSELKALDALALKMGKDTVFSAQDAAEAMLELGKGGMTVAQIKAGALAETMTLAAAGGMELGEAANTVVQAMGAFGLEASEANVATAALAGGANASSASLDDMVQALRQVGTVANSSGLSIQETTGMLALLADQGIRGSDAGTSLRTMLSRLVPTTDSAKAAMKELNLSYLDGNGNMVDAQQIMSRTQKAFKGLSDSERSRAIQTIFGQDAQRAVNALLQSGEGDLRKYIESTSDLTQAEKLADAAMSGTKGSLEQLRGSVETAQIQFGKGLAPTIRWAAKALNDFVSSGDAEKLGRDIGAGVRRLAEDFGPLIQSAYELGRDAWPVVSTAAGIAGDALGVVADVVGPLVSAFSKLPGPVKDVAVALGLLKLAQMGKLGSMAQGITTLGVQTEAAGAKAQRGSKGFRSFAGSLKGMGAIGAGVGLLSIADQAGKTSDSLGALATIAGSTAIGFGLGGPWGGVAGATVGTLQAIASSSDDAAGSMSNLKAIAGTVGASLNQVTGAYTSNSRATAAKALADQGALQAAQDLGISYQLVLDAAMGVEGAQSKLNKAMEASATSMIKNGQWTEKQEAQFDLLKNSVYATATSFEDARAKIIAMTSAMTGIPESVITKFEAPGADGAVKTAINVARQYALTPKQVKTVLKALDYSTPQIRKVLKELFGLDGTEANPMIKVIHNADSVSRAVKRYLKGIKDEEVIIRIIRHHEDRRSGRSTHPGPMGERADGAVVDYFGRGGIRENHIAQIAPAGQMRVWAEPETGGEAYIPLAPSKRARSMNILRETARRMGADVYAGGGMTGGSPGSLAIDYDRLADAVLRGISGAKIPLESDNRFLQIKTKRG